MKSASSLATFVAFTAFTTISAQSTSLIIPGFDPQPLSADVIGVDAASGQTTWAVQAGPGGDFPGTATLIEGSNYASINYIGGSPETTFTMAYGCTYQGGQAICSGAQDGQVVTETNSVVDTPIAVVIGTTAPAAASGPSVTPTPSASPATSGGMATSVRTTPSSTGGSSASSPTQSSGAVSKSSTWRSVLALFSVLTVEFAMST